MSNAPLIVPLSDGILFLNKEIKKLNKKIKDSNAQLAIYHSVLKEYPDAQVVSDKRYDDRSFICSKGIIDTLLFEVENDGAETWILPYKLCGKQKVYYDSPKFAFWSGYMGYYQLNGYYKNLLSHGFPEELCKACDKHFLNFLIQKNVTNFDSTLASKHLKEMLVFL
jgi:hypothetical protein